MSKAVVFISYRFEGDAARAKALSDALKATGSIETTLALENLRQGHEWKPQLYRWLARCDAGLVLVTPNMLNNPGWVLQETTILRARNILEPGRFPLFLLIDPKAKAHEGWRLFAPLDLPDIQLPQEGTSDEELAAIVQKRLGEVAAGDTGDYFRCLQSLIGDQLQPFLGFSGLTKLLYAKLDEADAQWHSLIGNDTALASALSQRICEGRTSIGQFSGLDTLLQAFKTTGEVEHRMNLLSALRPYWVSLHAASQLACARSRPAGQRLCVIRTAYATVTTSLHVSRCWAPYRTEPLVWPLTAGNDGVPDLAAQLVDAYNKDFRPFGRPAEEPEVRAGLERQASQVVVLLPPMKLPQIARGLAARFPAPLYVQPVAHDTRTDGPEWDGFVQLAPVTPEPEETVLLEQFGAAWSHARWKGDTHAI